MRTDGSMGGAKSSRARTRVAAAQAVLCVILLLVVYLTLLRPDSEDGLFAVKARQGNEFNAGSPSPSADGEGKDSRQAPDEEGGATAAGGLPPGSLDAPQGTIQPSSTPGTSRPGQGEEDSPTDHQYGDAVSRLLGRLGEPD